MNIGKLRDKDALAILREGTLGRLGCIAPGWPYVVPVNYFFDGKDIYIHTLPGKKLDALRADPRVCLQVDEIKGSSFFAQDTPPINASFWVERNAPPLSYMGVRRLFASLPNLA